jgi:1-acyl-sn-glycerol-3-phosphate acyltransferase
VTKKNKQKKIKNRRWFMCILRGLVKIFIRKPKMIYLGEKVEPQSVLLSNHVGSSGPLTLECYFKDQPFRFWGTYEMNGSLKEVYKYLSEIYAR